VVVIYITNFVWHFLFTGVINIRCDCDNGNVTFQGEVPKGFMSTIQGTTNDLTDKMPLIKDNKSER
jgi:hypothetical protein